MSATHTILFLTPQMRQDFELSNIFTVSLLSSHQNSSFRRVSCELSNKTSIFFAQLEGKS